MKYKWIFLNNSRLIPTLNLENTKNNEKPKSKSFFSFYRHIGILLITLFVVIIIFLIAIMRFHLTLEDLFIPAEGFDMIFYFMYIGIYIVGLILSFYSLRKRLKLEEMKGIYHSKKRFWLIYLFSSLQWSLMWMVIYSFTLILLPSIY